MKILATKKDVERWNNTGLLAGLNEKEQYRLALILNKVLHFLFEMEYKLDFNIISILLPLATRIFHIKREMIDIDCIKMIKCIKKAQTKINVNDFYSHIDDEVKQVELAAKLYLNQKLDA